MEECSRRTTLATAAITDMNAKRQNRSYIQAADYGWIWAGSGKSASGSRCRQSCRSACDALADISNLDGLNTLAYSTSSSSRWGCLSTAVGVMLLLPAAYAFMTGYLPHQFFNSQQWQQVERSDDYPITCLQCTRQRRTLF